MIDTDAIRELGRDMGIPDTIGGLCDHIDAQVEENNAVKAVIAKWNEPSSICAGEAIEAIEKIFESTERGKA